MRTHIQVGKPSLGLEPNCFIVIKEASQVIVVA